jgi:ornithine cyclodeaminase/alanine dehydrogenase-like protein (mu-crystallin family)
MLNGQDSSYTNLNQNLLSRKKLHHNLCYKSMSSGFEGTQEIEKATLRLRMLADSGRSTNNSGTVNDLMLSVTVPDKK